jgi:hypothetical protein
MGSVQKDPMNLVCGLTFSEGIRSLTGSNPIA